MEKINQLIEFLKDVRVESRKLVFPSKKDTIGATYAVIFAVLLIGFYLGAVDVGLSKIVERLIH